MGQNNATHRGITPQVRAGMLIHTLPFLKMTEVFYHNTYNQLQQIRLHNMDAAAFLDSTKDSAIRIFCILENGIIKSGSSDFANVEAALYSSLLNILC